MEEKNKKLNIIIISILVIIIGGLITGWALQGSKNTSLVKHLKQENIVIETEKANIEKDLEKIRAIIKQDSLEFDSLKTKILEDEIILESEKEKTRKAIERSAHYENELRKMRDERINFEQNPEKKNEGDLIESLRKKYK